MITCPACGASVATKNGVEVDHSSGCYLNGVVTAQVDEEGGDG